MSKSTGSSIVNGYKCSVAAHHCILIGRVGQSACDIRTRFPRAICNKGNLHMLGSSRRIMQQFGVKYSEQSLTVIRIIAFTV